MDARHSHGRAYWGEALQVRPLRQAVHPVGGSKPAQEHGPLHQELLLAPAPHNYYTYLFVQRLK